MAVEERMANLQVRILTPEDLDQVMKIEEASFNQSWSREAYSHEFTDNPIGHFFGLFADETLLAYGGYWQIMDEGHIANCAVAEKYRRGGLGEVLMRYLMNNCLADGGKRMTLEVRRSNEGAIKLYNKLGFVGAGYRPGYYSDNQEDALIMWVELNDK
ncbi:MAG: ribosomal protein S18-alanine N-acetyltransferase [Clostridiales bacterium]